MSNDEQTGTADPQEKTVKTAGHIVKYSRELYNLDSVEEVANLTLEMSQHFLEGHPMPAVIEVREQDLRVLGSMLPGLSMGKTEGPLLSQAYQHEQLLVSLPDDVALNYDGDDVTVVDPAAAGVGDGSGPVVVAPRIYSDAVRDTGALLVVQYHTLDAVEQYHVKPVDYLAEHVATAIDNIRSHERLERARNDLAKRKEMLEVYDRLLRHDLGNDLQVISGFSSHLLNQADDDQLTEYAEKINRTAQSSTELIDKVGQTVKTLQKEGEPEAKPIEPILTDVVENVDAKFESLSIEYDPDDFQFQAYAGDLIDSVFTNILSNAAVHNDGDITVRVYSEEPTPDTVIVGMADDGKGVDPGIREDIFEMGKKGPESEGTGFGLGLARTLVESYGGAVDVGESEFGGADFRVTLDRA